MRKTIAIICVVFTALHVFAQAEVKIKTFTVGMNIITGKEV